jgi:hypothetical protein
MKQKSFKVSPNELSKKIEELNKKGWKIISTIDTSTPITKPDAHGVSYGGKEITIIAENDEL